MSACFSCFAHQISMGFCPGVSSVLLTAKMYDSFVLVPVAPASWFVSAASARR